MYVFFDLDKNECYKANDLQNLKNFVDNNFTIKIDWKEAARYDGAGGAAKVLFSDCEKYSIEVCKDDLKGKHLLQTIASATDPLEKQN